VGVAELSAGRVTWARNAEAMSRLGNDSDFSMTFSDFYNLESLVLPDSQVHPFYTPSSRPIFGDGGDVRVFGDVMAVLWRCSAMLWRCSAMLWRSYGVRRCYGGVLAVFGDYGGVRDDALKDELYRIRGRGPPPDDPPSFNSRS